jgi:arginase
MPERSARTYHVLGVPLRAGSLYPGSEDDARVYREAQLVGRLRAADLMAIDEGDVGIPSYLPHHAVPPIKNWPGPRIAWECVGERVLPLVQRASHVPLLIGCDCSVVLGTTRALSQGSGSDVHVLYIDGDFDDGAPDAGRCQSAAALAVWLLTHASPFCAGPPLDPAQVTVIGASAPSLSVEARMPALTLADVRRAGPRQAAEEALGAIPASAAVLVHLDIDVFRHAELPAAYFPHADGLTLAEGGELLRSLLSDPRVRLLEVSEYAALRDAEQRSITRLVDVLVDALKPS